MDIENYFPRLFSVQQRSQSSGVLIEFNLFKVGEILRWEGYYKSRRISLYHNSWYWIVEAYWRGEVCGYFRSYKSKIELPDVERLVQAACVLIDIFEEEK